MRLGNSLALVLLVACDGTVSTPMADNPGTPATVEAERLVCTPKEGRSFAGFDELRIEVLAAKNAQGRYPVETIAKKAGQLVDFPIAGKKFVDAGGTLSQTAADLKLSDGAAAPLTGDLVWTGVASTTTAGEVATGDGTLAVVALESTLQLTCVYRKPTPGCTDKPQKILVLDFKSGWWAGDGGEFFKTILDGLALACESKVALEYHHITGMGDLGTVPPGGPSTGVGGVKPPGGIGGVTPPGQPGGLTLLTPSRTVWATPHADGSEGIRNMMMTFPNFSGQQETKPGDFETGFVEKDWSAYTQIWVLSGSASDPADIDVAGAFYTGVLDRLEKSGASVFIGSGNGSITHANGLTAKLGLGSRFATDLPEGSIIFPKNVTVTTTLKVGQELDAHPVLTQGVTSVADTIAIMSMSAASDYVSSVDGLAKVGRNSAGKDSIVTSAGEGRKLLLDAGLQRYYAISDNKSPETLQFLRNVIQFLSK